MSENGATVWDWLERETAGVGGSFPVAALGLGEWV